MNTIANCVWQSLGSSVLQSGEAESEIAPSMDQAALKERTGIPPIKSSLIGDKERCKKFKEKIKTPQTKAAMVPAKQPLSQFGRSKGASKSHVRLAKELEETTIEAIEQDNKATTTMQTTKIAEQTFFLEFRNYSTHLIICN